MAKPKLKKAQQRPLPPPDDDEDLVPEAAPPATDPPALDDDSDGDVQSILAELGGISDASITVKKITVQGEARVGSFMPSEFSLDSLRDRYGGGTYWIYFLAGGRIKHKRRVIFALSLEEQRGDAPGGRSSSPAPAGTNGELVAMVERQAQRDREMMQLVLQALTQNRPAANDMQTVFDMASKLANLGKRDGGGDPIEQLLRYSKLMKEIGGEGSGDSSGLVEVAKLFVEKLPALTSPGANGQAPAAAGDQSQMLSLMIRRALAARLPMLIQGAQRDTDAGVYAQLVLDQVPEIYLGPLLEQLQKPDWFNLLVQIDGRVVPLQAWFEQLRAAILEATQGPPPPAA